MEAFEDATLKRPIGFHLVELSLKAFPSQY